MNREELTLPIAVGVVLTLIVAVVAGLGDWSAPAIYGGMAVVGVVFVALLVRQELRHPGEHRH